MYAIIFRKWMLLYASLISVLSNSFGIDFFVWVNYENEIILLVNERKFPKKIT